MSLKEAIKAEARRLGFELAGVTTPDPPPHLEVYDNWLRAGRHGEMAYLASERARKRRADPREILPECQAILVLGMRYPAPESAAEAEAEPAGRVAAYAWGDDYHEVLAERLQRLVDFIEGQAGGAVPKRWYTDTGALLERELAQRAGLGWIGKNTCLIHPQHGSYFLLAEVLLGMALEADEPFEADRCGSCRRCLEACPTACILPDRTLDARRCISYLTIELKGAIPAEVRTAVGEWVFGCDICQQVCPWNQRFAAREGDPAFKPREETERPVLAEELALSPESFQRKFKGSAVQRAKRGGYLRNVATALGNAKEAKTIPHLAKAVAGDPEGLVRGHAAWALGQMGGEAARKALEAALINEAETMVRVEIEAALRGIDGPKKS